ncbi:MULTISPECIES: hypothetical protein [Acinetobacter]|jgi:hypothetical protein|uniref:Uncharacterized protein n=2 Tax=Acinetobacter baumannii TaxID=470 RepID=A0A090B7W4_ACIBA|nr:MULTISPECIES: hypothetical protein [Acinetobacter]AKQ32518.1 hypothetical protein ACX61_19125 [Acinetobacter baumannii]AMQ95753.1 hypothetical protein [Acinetobacter baumannii]ASS85533.1 hypothetical protein [Acinetobacter baumannii]EHU1275486.1 hypothetical protein [Acinetobacter baumannii]EHU1276557.1 hypothetical protein [Acinetobacter baumannii]
MLNEVTMSAYQIKHNYDIGDRGIFIKFLDQPKSDEVKNLAIYLQFKAELILDESITLDNMTIAQFLWLQGAKILDNKPDTYCVIDMYFDRYERCGEWYRHSFSAYDEKYGEQASKFLINKARGKILEGNVI